MEEFYTVNQAAVALKVHPLTVRRYIREGKLKAVRVGGNVRVAVNDLRAFVQDFMVYQSTSKVGPLVFAKQFTIDDPIFQVNARGFSLSKLNKD